MDTIKFNGKHYLSIQASHNAARFILPFANEFCKGNKGLDIGYGKKEWKLPHAIGVDLKDGQDAINLEHVFHNLDYIFSSHCLEHLPNWVEALDHWIDRLKVGGHLFLYLPHPDQEYWRPWNNKKHIHILEPIHVAEYLKHKGVNFFVSGIDLNYSYSIIAEKV